MVMMRVSLLAVLATSCYGAAVVRSGKAAQGNLHYDYMGRLKSDSGAGRDKKGAHYDYMGRLKSESGASTTGAVTASGAVKAAAPKAAPEDPKMDTGFAGAAEDLPTIANPKQTPVASTSSSSTPAKAGASGPSFHSDDGNSEHPNIVDTVQYDRNPVEEQESGSSFSFYLILACAGGVIAWMKTSEQNRSQAKDKANSAMQMLGPLVNEAMGAAGAAIPAVSAAMKTAASAPQHIQNASFHTRILQTSSYQKAGPSDDDELVVHDPSALIANDDYSKADESFFYDEEPVSVPAAPLDLFDDAPPAPTQPALLEFGEPQALDTCGFDL